VGVVNNTLARFLPGGFYYKTFIHPRAFWKHVFEPVIRQSAGLGKAPKDRDADRYEQAYAHCDVLVIGGGLSDIDEIFQALPAAIGRHLFSGVTVPPVRRAEYGAASGERGAAILGARLAA